MTFNTQTIQNDVLNSLKAYGKVDQDDAPIKANDFTVELIRDIAGAASYAVSQHVMDAVESAMEEAGLEPDSNSKDIQLVFNVACELIENELDNIQYQDRYYVADLIENFANQ